MTKATFDGLVQFVKAQPHDRVVDHTSWTTCAVGDYLIEEGYIDLIDCMEHVTKLLGAGRIASNPFMYYLAMGEGDTYGELQHEIKELGL